VSHTLVSTDHVRVVGNSDWSGMVEVSFAGGKEPVVLPGWVLRSIVVAEARPIMRREILKAFGVGDDDV
jgi:hypothetical protein